MKRNTLTRIGVVAAVFVVMVQPANMARAQGRLTFANNSQSALTNGLNGQRLPVGTDFLVELYIGDVGMPDSTFVPVTASMGTARTTINVVPGVFNGGPLALVNLPGGSTRQFQVRAWQAAFPTYEFAVMSGFALVGKTRPVEVTVTELPNPPPSLVSAGLTGTKLYPTDPAACDLRITCPANMSVPVGPSGTGAIVTFSPTVSTRCYSATTTCTHASGASFGVGTTRVTCTASDGAGNTNSCSFNITVGVPPTITAQPADLVASLGGAAMFAVRAQGSVPLSYQWYSNSIAITDQTSSNLLLANLQFTNTVAFQAIVANSFGAATSLVATLQVTGTSPAFATHPTNQTVSLGGNASFTAVATGSPLLSYQWLSNGVLVAGATSNVLALPNVQFTNTVQYRAVVTNPLGSATSQVAMLTVTIPAGATNVLIPFGAVWKYLYNGIDQDTAWRAPGFNDTAWPSGPAELGYGDGDEATPIGTGNTAPTAYFRRIFSVSDPSQYSYLRVVAERDDGIVVYLNGVEVLRDNLPPGDIGFTTFAVSTIEPDNSVTRTTCFSTLVPGNNVLAAEVHQSGPGSSDLSFNLELTGFHLPAGNNVPPAVAVLSPGPNVVLTGSAQNFEVAASDADGPVCQVELFESANRIGLDTAPPYTFVWPAGTPGIYDFFAVATDPSGQSATSGVVRIRVADLATVAPRTIFPTGSVWRYLDTGTNLGTAWIAPSFDDTAWPGGPAELGYGNSDEATVVNGGPVNARFITTYFRRSFDMPTPASFDFLTLNVRRDDGVAVYLNGTEVHRDNLPPGPITSATLANQTVSDDSIVFISNIPNLLLPGRNVIAAEVHQVLPTSSDISFELEMIGHVTVLPPLDIVYRRGGPGGIPAVTLTWTTANATLQASTTMTGTWQNLPTATSPYVISPVPAGRCFFRLARP